MTTAAQRSVLHLAWPVTLSFVLRQLFTFVDMAFAKTMGDAAVAGIGLCYPIEFLMIACWVGTSNAMTSLLSRALGAHEGERAAQVIRTTRRIVWVLVAAFSALGAAIWIFAPRFALAEGERGLGIPADVLEPFRIYASVIVAGTAITGFWSILPDSIVKAHQDTKATMWAGMWSNLVNVVLNVVFLFVFHWGMFGIALSTVIGRVAALTYAQSRARRHEQRRLEAAEDTAPGSYERPLRALLAIGLPAAAGYVLMACESAIVNLFLSRTPAPTESLAAFAVYHRWLFLFLMPVIAGGVALLPFTGRLWGRGDVTGIRRSVRDVSLAAVAYAVLLVAPLAVLAPHALVRLFADSPLAREWAAEALRLSPLAVLAAIPFLAWRSVLEGMQLPKPALVVGAVRYLALTAPVVALAVAFAAGAQGPPIVAIAAALVVAAALSSAALWAWASRLLGRAEAAGSG